ncbi:MAG: hypothetical protein AAF892_08115 [Cyanobacteria bacterium P01_D01_bin.71]
MFLQKLSPQSWGDRSSPETLADLSIKVSNGCHTLLFSLAPVGKQARL